MGEITWEMRQKYHRTVGWIPADLVPHLDQDEILDRLDDAEALWTKFEKAPQDVAPGYLERARQICRGLPRDQVEAEAARWLAKAEQAYTPQHAAGCREQARLIRQDNPTATRRQRPRTTAPSPEQQRHADAVALLKADVEARVTAGFAALDVRSTAAHDQLRAGISDLTGRIEQIKAERAATGVQTPDITKAATTAHILRAV